MAPFFEIASCCNPDSTFATAAMKAESTACAALALTSSSLASGSWGGAVREGAGSGGSGNKSIEAISVARREIVPPPTVRISVLPARDSEAASTCEPFFRVTKTAACVLKQHTIRLHARLRPGRLIPLGLQFLL